MRQDLSAITIGTPTVLNDRITLCHYDPSWPRLFAEQAATIRASIGEDIVDVHHVGSTSVPGLCAKPIIDILLVVSNSADETRYVPALENGGYRLRIREPDWFEHRLLKADSPQVNLHVFSHGCPEIDRMLAFRNHLRINKADRLLYQSTKRALAEQSWQFTQDYADAKTDVIRKILERAIASEAAR